MDDGDVTKMDLERGVLRLREVVLAGVTPEDAVCNFAPSDPSEALPMTATPGTSETWFSKGVGHGLSEVGIVSEWLAQDGDGFVATMGDGWTNDGDDAIPGTAMSTSSAE